MEIFQRELQLHHPLSTNMLRPALFRIGNSLKISRRSLHNVPILNHNFNNGVPGLLSPAGFDMAWTQYQALMVEKLNILTAGMSIATRSIAR